MTLRLVTDCSSNTSRCDCPQLHGVFTGFERTGVAAFRQHDTETAVKTPPSLSFPTPAFETDPTSQVRAEVFHTLEGGTGEDMLRVPLCNDNLLINELVRDYLSYNGYSNALSVFMTESGQPKDGALDRAFLRDEVRGPSRSLDWTTTPVQGAGLLTTTTLQRGRDSPHSRL